MTALELAPSIVSAPFGVSEIAFVDEQAPDSSITSSRVPVG